MDVFADPNASKTTQAELPVSLGLMASLSANVAIQSVGDPSGGGGFRGYVGGAGVAKRVPPATTVTVTIRPPGPPHPPQILIPVSCVVEVCCTGAGSASSPAWHCFTKCTKTFPDGRTEVIACRGGPSGLLRDLWPTGVPSAPNAPPPCDGWTILDGAWGPIDTYCGPYQRGHPDWRQSPLPCEDVTSDKGCELCECIREIMCRMEFCCVRYELLPELYGFNSNSTAFTAIDECQPPGNGPQPLPQPTPPLGAPGWETVIPLLDCPTCPHQ